MHVLTAPIYPRPTVRAVPPAPRRSALPPVVRWLSPGTLQRLLSTDMTSVRPSELRKVADQLVVDGRLKPTDAFALESLRRSGAWSLDDDQPFDLLKEAAENIDACSKFDAARPGLDLSSSARVAAQAAIKVAEAAETVRSIAHLDVWA